LFYCDCEVGNDDAIIGLILLSTILVGEEGFRTVKKLLWKEFEFSGRMTKTGHWDGEGRLNDSVSGVMAIFGR
jgi:hypothetical protein